MPAPRKYPQELRERAMRLVVEARKEDPEPSLNAAVILVGQRTGVSPDTLASAGDPHASSLAGVELPSTGLDRAVSDS